MISGVAVAGISVAVVFSAGTFLVMHYGLLCYLKGWLLGRFLSFAFSFLSLVIGSLMLMCPSSVMYVLHILFFIMLRKHAYLS